MLHCLRHVAAAIRHAEMLADEASDLELHELADRLRRRGEEVTQELDAALVAFDDVEPARAARTVAHERLSGVYADTTLRIEAMLVPEAASVLNPGGHLDVTERTRYRIRRLPDDRDVALASVRADLERALFAHDVAVDIYLLACATAQTRKVCAVVKSQALRLELERAKHQLLVRADVGSDAYRRIRARTVRTKRARWLDEARAAELLARAS